MTNDKAAGSFPSHFSKNGLTAALLFVNYKPLCTKHPDQTFLRDSKYIAPNYKPLLMNNNSP
ncbi:MAG: hypothetical protein F6K41_31475 [Symploca sp. SIO3E6]|nr:hypothetical protein [Caldora sp. SIO3E6]